VLAWLAGAHLSTAVTCAALSELSEKFVGGLGASTISMDTVLRHFWESTTKIITLAVTKTVMLAAGE